MEQPEENTDTELFRENEGDYYSPSLHKTEHGKIGIDVGGTVYVKSLREWHKLAEQSQETRPHETIVNCTPSEKAIEIAKMQDTFDNKILMVLSSHITHGSSEGALVSAKEFDQILQDMKYLFKRCN